MRMPLAREPVASTAPKLPITRPATGRTRLPGTPGKVRMLLGAGPPRAREGAAGAAGAGAAGAGAEAAGAVVTGAAGVAVAGPGAPGAGATGSGAAGWTAAAAVAAA